MHFPHNILSTEEETFCLNGIKEIRMIFRFFVFNLILSLVISKCGQFRFFTKTISNTKSAPVDAGALGNSPHVIWHCECFLKYSILHSFNYYRGKCLLLQFQFLMPNLKVGSKRLILTSLQEYLFMKISEKFSYKVFFSI